MDKRFNPTQERLQELFEYKDGVFYWKKQKYNPHSRYKIGDEAGSIIHKKRKLSRVQISFDGGRVLRSRAVWVYHKGDTDFTSFVIDHINQNSLDDRIENLRLVSQRENMSNRRGQSKYGVGVYKSKETKQKPFHVLVFVGCFETAKEAQTAYQDALLKLGI